MMPSIQELDTVQEGEILSQENHVTDDHEEAVETISLYPTDGAICRVTITTAADDLDPSMSGYGFGDLEIQLGEGDSPVCDAIDSKLRKMEEGDSCQLFLPGIDSAENSDSKDEIALKIFLQSFTRFRYVYEMDNEAKLDFAMKQKMRGVELFKQGNIPYAFLRFSRALKYCIMMYPLKNVENETLKSECQNLQCQCYTNMAACQLKHESFKFVIENCSKALDIESENVKALYRRGDAYFHLGQYQLAKEDALRGLAFEPKSRMFQTLVKNVQEKMLRDNKQ